jgi:hypothetical protein
MFKLRNKEHNLDELIESNEEVEESTPIIRRFEQVRKLV